MYKLQALLKEFNQSSGYYDIFIPTNVMGGLDSAVEEVLAESGVPCKFKRLGVL